MKILLHDYGGYAFIVELSRKLAARGHQVFHLHAAHNPTPRGVLRSIPQDPTGLRIDGITTGGRLRKSHLLDRWRQERRYGRLLSRAVLKEKPDIVLSANTPLDAQQLLQRACLNEGVPFVFWLQDLIGRATSSILARKLGMAGGVIGWFYIQLEARLLRQSQAVILISDQFRSFLDDHHINPSMVSVIPNWPPIEQLPVLKKDNPWSRRNGFHEKFCFLYTGSLGLKHDLEPLVWLAGSDLANEAKIVVVSEGEQAERLKAELATDGMRRLELFPFQPMERYPEVLASGDVLLALLEQNTADFSVPSKVLSYLCAGRPILMVGPQSNPAAEVVENANAGIVVSPGDRIGLLQAAERLASDNRLRKNMGEAARDFADSRFDLDLITNQFEVLLTQVANR